MLPFIPTKEDAGKHLSCRAENPIMPSAPIEDVWTLEIQCKLENHNLIFLQYFSFIDKLLFFTSITKKKQFFSFSDVPETKIRLGTSLNPDTIREGTDVYFDCLIKAEPSVYKVEWRHEVCINLEF